MKRSEEQFPDKEYAPEMNYKSSRPQVTTAHMDVTPEMYDLTSLYEAVKFRRNNQLI